MRPGEAAVSGLLSAIDPVVVFERNGITPDPEQLRLLRAMPCMALVCWSRQTGKSTTFGGYAEHVANANPGALILIASKNQDKAKELLAKTVLMHEPFESENPLVVQTTERLVYRNRAEVRAIPATLISARGPTAKLVLMDEAAWTSRELLEAIFPTMARTGGSIIAMSTPPEEPDGWWWEAWTGRGELSGREALALNGKDMWLRSFVTYEDVQYASEGHIRDARTLLTPEAFDREYLCKFPEIGRSGNRLPISPEQFDAIFAKGDDDAPKAME